MKTFILLIAVANQASVIKSYENEDPEPMVDIYPVENEIVPSENIENALPEPQTPCCTALVSQRRKCPKIYNSIFTSKFACEKAGCCFDSKEHYTKRCFSQSSEVLACESGNRMEDREVAEGAEGPKQNPKPFTFNPFASFKSYTDKVFKLQTNDKPTIRQMRPFDFRTAFKSRRGGDTHPTAMPIFGSLG